MAIELNERQRRAVEHVRGPMLVLAGAGTGKTTVLVRRCARLIEKRHARPGEILAITYTENAAAELRQRVSEHLGAECGLQPSTFHAYCLEILRRCGQGFRVINHEDLWVYLRRRLGDLPLEHFRPARNPAEFLHALLAFFDRCHDELITPDKYDAYVQRLRHGEVPLPRIGRTSEMEGLKRDDVLARCAEIARVFRKVEEMLRAENLGTFGHMISGAIALLQKDAGLLAHERTRARFILIDEFQDANVGQIELAALLGGAGRNVFAVGDPDQAIYRFRGASSAAFDEFRRRFPGADAVVLNENQRSTSKILDSSFAVIARNPQICTTLDSDGRTFARQRLRSAREQRARAKHRVLDAVPVQIVLATDVGEEAADVAAALEELHQLEGAKLDCAVLYRLHSHRDELAKELAWRKIPFTVRGLNTLETPDLRDAMAGLGALHSERDNASLFRLSSLPVFGLDRKRVQEELRLAGRNPEMAAVLKKVPGGAQVLAVLDEARAQLRAAGLEASAALELASKYFHLPQSAPLAALSRFIADWQQKPITASGKLEAFLEYLELFGEAGGAIELPPQEELPGTVQLMTAHAAKGLEFEHVFVLRANSGSFPMGYREALFEFPHELREISQPEVNDADIHREEERRLFYVAMTRAKDRLTICARPGRGKDTRPPGFLRDLMCDSASYTARAAREGLTLHAGLAHSVSALGEWLLAPPVLPQRDLVLSATAIQAYKDCPLQFKIRREWNVPGEIAAALQFGNAMHTALKGYYDAVRAGRPQGQDQLLDCFREALSTMYFDDELQRQLYLRQGKRQLAEFFAAQQALPPPDVIATEKTFEIVVAGVRVRGRIDRLDRIAEQRVALTDYKTGSARNQQHADESLQLSIYALACREWELLPERLVFYNLDTNEEVVTSRGDAALRKTIEEVREVAGGIAAGEFDANRGFHCRFCAYRKLCPETEEWVGN